MTIKHSSLDVYFHMRNHYKKLRLAKAVIKNRPSSAPKKLTPFSSPARKDVADKADEEEGPQPSKQARPASETNKLDPTDLEKLKKAHYPYHSIHLAKHDCSRPVTRRNPSDMPENFESPTRLSQGEEREWNGSDALLPQPDANLELLQDQPDNLEQPDKLAEDSDQNEETPRKQNADRSVFKYGKHQQLGCVCGAIYAGGEETYGSTGALDIGYLEIWEFDKGEESKQGSGTHKGRKSISKVYTVLPVAMDLPTDSCGEEQKKRESCSNKSSHCNKTSCKGRKEDGGVGKKSNVAEKKEKPETERYTSESETTDISKQDSDVAEKQEKPETEKYASESETESSKQDSKDVDVAQQEETMVETDDAQQPTDDDNNTETERPSRSRIRPGSKSTHRDSLQVTRLRRSQDANRDSYNKFSSREPQRDTSSIGKSGSRCSNNSISRAPKRGSSNMGKARSSNKSISREPPQRDSPSLEKSISSSEDKSDSIKKQCSTRSSVIEHEYLQFSLRITEDIIRNDLYNNDEMKRVFNSHIEANRGRLDMNKMKERIKDLCAELNIAYDNKIGRSSCREDVGKVQENLKNIICFASPRKNLCHPCDGQLTNQVTVDNQVKLDSQAKVMESEVKVVEIEVKVDDVVQPLEKESSGAEPELKFDAPSENVDKPAPSVIDEKELNSARNNMRTPPLQTFAETTPPTPSVIDEKELRGARNNMRTLPLQTIAESTPPTPSVIDEKELRGARNKMRTPPLQTIAESTPPTEGKQLRTVGPQKPLRSVSPARKRSITPTKAGSRGIMVPKTKLSFSVGESDKAKANLIDESDKTKPPDLSEVGDDAVKSSEKIEEPKLDEVKAAKTDFDILVEQMPEAICSVCCAGKAVCVPFCPENRQSTHPEARLPTASIGDDARRRSISEEVKSNLIFVAPQVSNEKKDFAAMVRQPQKNQTTQGSKTTMDHYPPKVSKKCKADKIMQKDTLTGIPALDNTLRNYNLEMLAQNCGGPSRFEYHTQTEPSCNILQESYKYKCTDFVPSQKTTTDEFVVVSGPIYIPAHVIEPNSFCDCGPLSSLLKQLPRTCTEETCNKTPCNCAPLSSSVKPLPSTYADETRKPFPCNCDPFSSFIKPLPSTYADETCKPFPKPPCNCVPLSSFMKPLHSTCTNETCSTFSKTPPCNSGPISSFMKPLPNAPAGTKKNLLLSDDYNYRNQPDISMFYPTVSTQTSSSDLSGTPYRKKLASAYKSFSNSEAVLETKPATIVSIDSLNKIVYESTETKKITLPPETEEEQEPSKEESQLSQLIDTLKEKQRQKKQRRMKDMIVPGDQEDAEVPEQGLVAAEDPTEESSDMFIVETKSSKDGMDQLKHKIDQMIDMRGEDNGSDDSADNGPFVLKYTGSDNAPQVMKQAKENEKPKKSVDPGDFMKKLDHKPDMSMTNSMAQSIKKVNRESQQFRGPDDKRITWGNRRLKIKKLTDSDNDVIQEEDEEQEQVSADKYSIKSDNNRIDSNI